jgi:hypothetical protein
MTPLIVIIEDQLDELETDVLGVASSVENAEKIINAYYGEFKEISKTKRSPLYEYTKVIEVKDHRDEPYKVELWLMYKYLDEPA